MKPQITLTPSFLLQERYELKSNLSETPTRQTWLARDRKTDSDVIVKLLPFGAQTQWQDLKLFDREAQTLKHLDARYIPRYLDYFTLDRELGGGLSWFALVQTYIPGHSLQQSLKDRKKFTEFDCQKIARALLKILIDLHELSPPVIHRDIKPSNIIQGNDGKIYLVDFGAVQDKARTEGMTLTVVGTGGYAPPEQLWGRAVAASDLYALGATLIHLLTGITPAQLPQQQMRLQFRDKANVSPTFASWLDRLIDPALEKRYANAREALTALEAAVRQRGQSRGFYGNLGHSVWVRVGAAILCVAAFPLFASYRYMTAGYKTVEAMNRAQQDYFQKNNRFADRIEKLNIAIKSDGNYQYYAQIRPLLAINQASSSRGRVKLYQGFVTLKSDGLGRKVASKAIVCEMGTANLSRLEHLKQYIADFPYSNSSTWEMFHEDRPQALFSLSDNGKALSCAPGMKQVGGSGGIEIVGESWQLAYQALDASLLYPGKDRAISLVEKIQDPEAKMAALEEIAITLITTDQINRALAILPTIPNHKFGKARIIQTMTVNITTGQQIDRVFELFPTLAGGSEKLAILQILSYRLYDRGQIDTALRLTQTLQNPQARDRIIQIIEHRKVLLALPKR